MDSKCVTCILVLMMVGLASSDLAKDRQECADQLVGLVTCLPYVSGEAKAPPLDCCSGLKQVLKDSKRCLCILVKDRNDPSLALLNLAPNSTDAKVFEDFANSSKGSNSTTPATNVEGNSTSNGSTSTVEVKSDGGRGKRWLVVEMVCVAIFSMVVHILLNM